MAKKPLSHTTSEKKKKKIKKTTQPSKKKLPKVIKISIESIEEKPILTAEQAPAVKKSILPPSSAEFNKNQVLQTKKKSGLLSPQLIRNSFRGLFLVLFVLGINILILGAVYQGYRRTILSFKVSPVTTLELAHRRGQPLAIEIPSLSMKLDISQSQIKDGVWETSDTHATHLDTSARPGERGNVVIYGHNRRKIFASLPRIKVGDKISIATEEGKQYQYTVTETKVVKPDFIEAVLPTDFEELTVYTCTGFLDSQRFVVKATPTQVSSW